MMTEPTSGRAFDHIVLAVSDLDAAAVQYESLGFTLTPRAQHPWGSANRLAQFAGGNFIELLEIDRPDLIFEHDQAVSPPTFSFGAHNRDFLARRCGMSMLVLQGSDSWSDVERYQAAGLDTYKPFDFERTASLPNGSLVTVAFSLAFTTYPEMPHAAFFTCHNKFPENFWKWDFQQHANGAQGIVEIIMVAEHPAHYAEFLSGFSGGRVERQSEDIAIHCGPNWLTVMTAASFTARYRGSYVDLSEGSYFGAIVIERDALDTRLISANDGCGLVVEMRRQR